MAAVDCNSEQSASADISSDGDIPHVKSSFGFTVYYEMSGKNSSNLHIHAILMQFLISNKSRMQEKVMDA
jgi:hypothetical protein